MLVLTPYTHNTAWLHSLLFSFVGALSALCSALEFCGLGCVGIKDLPSFLYYPYEYAQPYLKDAAGRTEVGEGS